MAKPERKILLNPGPGTTSNSVKQALLVPDICPREEEFGNLLKDTTQGLIQIGKGEGDYEVCLFAASGTGAVEAMLTSALGPNTKALIVTNGAYGFRMADICSSYNLTYDTICNYGDFPDAEAIRERLGTGEFTHLAIIHHETSTGMMNPLEKLSDLCGELGVRLIVDAMSSYGAWPMNLNKLNIGYLAASSNKCIHGMAGLSFVIFHKNCLKEIREGSKNFYFDIYNQWKYLKAKNQLRFTPPVQVCYAFHQAIQETLKETVEGRWKRYQKNWQIMYDGMKELGFSFFLPVQQQSGILMAIHLDDKLPRGFDHFHDYLYERGITVYPGVIPETETFRIAVIGDLYEEDMEYTIGTIREYLDR